MYPTTNIPLQARDLLDFNGASFLCLAGLFALGFALFFLLGKLARIRRKNLFRFLSLLVYCLLCAIGIFMNNNRNEREEQLAWAETIAYPRDLDAEEYFADPVARIAEDTALLHCLQSPLDHPSKRENLTRLLEERYLGDAFPGYLYFFTFCRPGEALLIEPENTMDCQEFFVQKELHGIPTGIEGLTAMDYGIEYYAYLLRLSWIFPSTLTGTVSPANGSPAKKGQVPESLSSDTLSLYVELGRKKFSDKPGDLGLHLPSRYSYGFYSEGDLWSHNGDFLYSFRIQPAGIDSLYFCKHKGYSHLFYPIPGSRLLILSTPEPDPWDIFHNFSLLFLLFGILGSIILWLTDKNFLGKSGSYAQRLRLASFAMILSAFLLSGGASLAFMKKWNQNENEKLLQNQTLSILAEMEERYLYLPASDLYDPSRGDSIRQELNQAIAQLSNLFRNDIYLYGTDGGLISGPDIRGIMPPVLDLDIIQEMLEEQSHLVIRHQTFEPQVDGLMAFTPFRNAQNQILGFFCIPYYTHEDEIRSEMNEFLGTYLNIVVLLVLVSLFLTYWLARRITQPLSLIANKVSQIRLTRKNEHLSWKGDDEIGTLVKQYNDLVDDLERSSRKLAESERENAWSEMARQVAHEIKNPLTPMKLQVQQLQRAYKDQKPDFGERLERFTAMLTSQIDHLAGIASTFSRFSQWQKPQMQEVVPAQVLQGLYLLFRADERTEFILDIPEKYAKTRILADPKYLEQILMNLIRNAIQALEEQPSVSGRNIIRLGIHEGYFADNSKDTTKDLLAEAPGTNLPDEGKSMEEGVTESPFLCLFVADNGPGIPEEKLSHIFEPHFTTRSTGTGLGLAICKRLAETMGGKILVQTRIGEGCHFSVLFKTTRQEG